MHVELIVSMPYKMLTLFMFTTDSMQFRPPNANKKVSDTNHFGFVSDSLGRLAALLSLFRFGHPMTLLRFEHKRIVNNESVHRKKQIATIINTIQ